MDAGLVVASNRGPISWDRTDSGELHARRGFGGLVTALGGALQSEPGTWVSVALDEAGREMAAMQAGATFTEKVSDERYELRMVDVGGRYHDYYNVVSNQQLWFTLHDLWNAPYTPTAQGWRAPYEDGFVPVNQAVADAVVEVAEPGQHIMLQDYHLALAPAMVRERLGDAAILQYLHTPWATPEQWARLPRRIRTELLEGLLAADVVALSSPLWTRAMRACAEVHLGARVEGDDVIHRGHRTRVADLVLGVDVPALRHMASSDAVVAASAALDEELSDRRLLLRVDRSDLSKNILRGLLAYEQLLEAHPELVDEVWHLGLINPSRQSVPAYRRYLDACRAAADRIRDRFGPHTCELRVTTDYPQSIAAFQRFDVLLANPVIDGTNLVAKEGPALGERDGVLVLSERAGAASVMADGALMINPFDVDETAEALHTALTMPASERRSRAERLRTAASAGAPSEWLAEQRRILDEVVALR